MALWVRPATRVHVMYIHVPHNTRRRLSDEVDSRSQAGAISTVRVQQPRRAHSVRRLSRRATPTSRLSTALRFAYTIYYTRLFSSTASGRASLLQVFLVFGSFVWCWPILCTWQSASLIGGSVSSAWTLLYMDMYVQPIFGSVLCPVPFFGSVFCPLV